MCIAATCRYLENANTLTTRRISRDSARFLCKRQVLRLMRPPWKPVHWVTAAVLGLTYWILARSCTYDHSAIGRYVVYLVVAIWLPGHCLLIWSLREPVGIGQSVALGLPLGFACEILLYLGCSAAGGKEAYPFACVTGSAGLTVWLATRNGWRNFVPRAPAIDAKVGLMLATLGVIFTATTAARMYAPSPLVNGLLQHSTHHDWVYLVSRAAEIKNHWPLEDPSMAGTPLHYHYFFMAHVAGASQTMGLEIPMVLLRLAFVPMGVALLAQVFLLGSMVGRSPRAGVLAAALLFATGEVSWLESTSGGWFQSLFISWLFISPTFCFGMVFTGALLLWMQRLFLTATDGRYFGVLFLFVLTGTGAKGTTAGPLAVATGLWCVWQALGRRENLPRMVLAGAVMGIGFLTAYAVFLRGYSGTGTALQPFAFSRVSAFWLEHVRVWQAAWQARGVPSDFANLLGGILGMFVVLAGLNGVLLLGLLHGFRTTTRQADSFAVWLGFVAVSCMAFGNLLFLDSHGESYLYLPMKLPLAVLTAAAAAGFWRRQADLVRLSTPQRQAVQRFLMGGICVVGVSLLVESDFLSWWSGTLVTVTGLFLLAPVKADGGDSSWKWEGLGRIPIRFALLLLPLLCLLTVQVRFFVLGNRTGFKLWQVSSATGVEPTLAELQEGLDWVRRNTPTDAIIVATMFSPEWATPDLSRIVDRTTLDKHYYYSALAERRLFVEGPAYLRDQGEAAERLQTVKRITLGGFWPLSTALQDSDVYLLVDRMARPVILTLPPAVQEVFGNRRVRVYRL